MSNNNVFINCPYDDNYQPIMHLIIYLVCKFNHSPKLSAMYTDVEDRMSKILNLIKECRIGIHDISYMELDEKNNLARFNMPFELGIDYAYKNYIDKSNKLLILEKDPYLSKKAISDLSGNDIVPHKNDFEEVIRCIRVFFVGLYNLTNVKYQAAILTEYQTSFESWLKERLMKLGYPEKYYKMKISIGEFVDHVKDFFKEHSDLLVKID